MLSNFLPSTKTVLRAGASALVLGVAWSPIQVHAAKSPIVLEPKSLVVSSST